MTENPDKPSKPQTETQRRLKAVRPHVQAALDKQDLDGVLKGLTPKQLAFVEAYLECLNQTKALRMAGYETKNPKEMTKQLMHNPAIRFAIDGLKAQRKENADVTSDYVLKRIVNVIDDAEEDGNANAVLRGLELLAKHLGMLVDRKEISGPDGGAIETRQRLEQSSEELKGKLSELTKRVDNVIPITGTS